MDKTDKNSQLQSKTTVCVKDNFPSVLSLSSYPLCLYVRFTGY